MLEARIVDPQGKTVKPVYADNYDKAFVKGLLSKGFHLCCASPACTAQVIHVNETMADGNTQRRVAHFRADEIQDHIPGCEYRNDPRDQKNLVSFKEALEKGLPILINILFLTGFDGLRNRFKTAVADPESGLYERASWLQTIGQDNKYLAVPARDITDILHYLELAKDYRGQTGLQQLWFNTHHAVQSCKRFVVADKAAALTRLEVEMLRRAKDTWYSANQYVNDTPRLFLIRTTNRQADIATTLRLKNLYGQAVISATPTPHAIKLGMKLEGNLTNQSMIGEGRNLWVVAAPLLSRDQIETLKTRKDNIERGIPVPAKNVPMFIFLQISKRIQYMAVNAVPLGKNAEARKAAALPPRQLEMNLGSAPKASPQGRGHRSGGRRWRTPRRGGPA